MGSEMCIRDSPHTVFEHHGGRVPGVLCDLLIVDRRREPRHRTHRFGLVHPSICELLREAAGYDAGAFSAGSRAVVDVFRGEA